MGIIADDGVIDMRMYLYFFSYVIENVEDEEKIPKNSNIFTT